MVMKTDVCSIFLEVEVDHQRRWANKILWAHGIFLKQQSTRTITPVPIPITNSHNHHANLHPSQPKSTFINPTFPTPFASIGNSIRLLPPSLSPPKSRVFSLSLVRKLLKHRWLHGRHTKVTMDSKKSGSKPRKMCSKRSLLRLSN